MKLGVVATRCFCSLPWGHILLCFSCCSSPDRAVLCNKPSPTRHFCWTQLCNRNILTGAKHRVHRVQVNSHTSRLIKNFTFCSPRHWNIGRVFPSWRMHFVAIIDLMPTLISQQCIFPPLVPPLFRSCIMQIAYFVVTLHLFFIFITKLEGLNFTLPSWSHITFKHV